MLFSYTIVAVDPISLWQLAHFRCGSWRNHLFRHRHHDDQTIPNTLE